MNNVYLRGVFNLIRNASGRMLIVVIVGVVTTFNVFAGVGAHERQEQDDASSQMHRHDSWVAPPAAYTDKVNNMWDDSDSAKRGKNIYDQYCLQCHGADGRGKGPIASSVEHAPADLTNHFHNAPGDGDAYLYWRVSEGGRVEPFISMRSVMPSFKMILSEPDRWDVLIYIHQAFHKTFTANKDDGGTNMPHVNQH